MLKTQHIFRLDHKYKGPFIIKAVTPTNVIIKVKDDSAAEELCVSQQSVLLCSCAIDSVDRAYKEYEKEAQVTEKSSREQHG